MLTYVIGDLFQSPAHVLVNTVNTVGVMGKGIAKKFKMIYPEMFKEYQQLCEKKQLTVGNLWLYKTPNKWILNFPTKTTWRQPSRLEYIDRGLAAFVRRYAERGITSIAFPALGCGNGELDWETQVRPLMEKYLRPLPIDVFIYIYGRDRNIPEHKDIKAVTKWLRGQPESLGFAEVWIDLKKIIGAGIQLKSFYDEKLFWVSCLNEDEGIRIAVDDNSLDIQFNELVSFWDVVRKYGFAIQAAIPPFAVPYIDYLLALVAKLPYVREICASREPGTLRTAQARGLQYIPELAEYPPLFKNSRKHVTAV